MPVLTGPEPHPASFTMGTGSLLGLKRPELSANHPPHSSAAFVDGLKVYRRLPLLPA